MSPGSLKIKGEMIKYSCLKASFACSSNIYTKEVLFCFDCELHSAHAAILVFTLYTQDKKEKVDSQHSTFLVHILASLMTSLIQTAGHKIAAPTVYLHNFKMSNLNKW